MNQRKSMSTKTLAYCSLLTALSIVLARLVIPMPAADTRFSIEAVPMVIAGILFGPGAGALVGFSADFIGCLFSPFGYNPLFCIPPILYGLFGGLCRPLLSKGVTPFRLVLTLLPPVVLGSIGYQSIPLSALYFKGGFWQGYWYYVTTRSIQFAITLVLDVLVIWLLFQSNIFKRIGRPLNK